MSTYASILTPGREYHNGLFHRINIEQAFYLSFLSNIFCFHEMSYRKFFIICKSEWWYFVKESVRRTRNQMMSRVRRLECGPIILRKYCDSDLRTKGHSANGLWHLIGNGTLKTLANTVLAFFLLTFSKQVFCLVNCFSFFSSHGVTFFISYIDHSQ